MQICPINPFSANFPLLYTLKTMRKLKVFDVFRKYRGRTLVENESLKRKETKSKKTKKVQKSLGNFFYSGIILYQNISIKLMEFLEDKFIANIVSIPKSDSWKMSDIFRENY